MRKSAQPVFEMLVEDPRLEGFTVKNLKDLADKMTGVLVQQTILKKFEKVSEADPESDDFESRLFGRIRAAGEAVNDSFLIQDLYMMMHLRDPQDSRTS